MTQKFSKDRAVAFYSVYALHAVKDLKETIEILPRGDFDEQRWGQFCGEAAVGDFLSMLFLATKTCPSGPLSFLEGMIKAVREISLPMAQALADQLEAAVGQLKNDPPDEAASPEAVAAAAAKAAELFAKLQRGAPGAGAQE